MTNFLILTMGFIAFKKRMLRCPTLYISFEIRDEQNLICWIKCFNLFNNMLLSLRKLNVSVTKFFPSGKLTFSDGLKFKQTS